MSSETLNSLSIPICEKRFDNIVIVLIGCLIWSVISCIFSAIQSAYDKQNVITASKNLSRDILSSSVSKSVFNAVDATVTTNVTLPPDATGTITSTTSGTTTGNLNNNAPPKGTSYFTIIGCLLNCVLCIYIIFLILRPKQINCLTK